MAALIGLFVGALVGHLLWRDWGAALGGIAGFIIGAKLNKKRAPSSGGDAKRSAGAASAARGATAGDSASGSGERGLMERIAELERRVAMLERGDAGLDVRESASPTTRSTRSAEPVADGAEPTAGAAASTTASALDPTATTFEPVLPASERTPSASPIESPPRPAESAIEAVPALESPERPLQPIASARNASPVAPKVNPLWAWFTGGNAMTRVGVVVLFFGIAFLLRYFAEHFTLPIEFRLAAVAAFGFALIVLGVRLAASRPGYGLSLQGAGAGILYLTTFAAFRLYGVLPPLPTVACLVAVSVLTVWLAVRNDSQPLAGLAIAGGFLAPVLVDAGGEPLQLFTYFAVLNGAIFALAWTRAWRALNVVGFVFTFVLATFWGQGFYRPEHYAVAQPFLILFFAFYVTIAILYAHRGPLVAKNPVDGLLVFGVPLVGFSLQAAIMRDARYGAAWSALALAVVYALLFLALRRRAQPGMPLLSRAFLALAVIFTTIAIPFAFDQRATAALWAVEAAGVYWIGVRQKAWLARAFALLIEFGAGIAFIASGVADVDDRLFANAWFAGALLIAASALATARIADGAGDALSVRERGVLPLVFGWGVVWWLVAGGVDLDRHLEHDVALHAILAWVTASVACALLLSGLMKWRRLAGAGLALLPAMLLAAIGDFDRARTTLTHYGWIVWPCAWLVHWSVLRAQDARNANAPATERRLDDWTGILTTLHAVSALMLVAQCSWEASEWAGRVTPRHTAWMPCAAALPAIAFLAFCVRFRDRALWPLTPHGDAYALRAGKPIAILLAIWFFMVNVLSPGDLSPLPYFPLANPLDITLALALCALFFWGRRFAGMAEPMLYRSIGAAAFVALNGIVLRTAHHWADIPWRISSLLASKPLQATLTLTWSATALAMMYVATRRGMRPLWMMGAALLAVVVGKLFLIDLGALSGLPRVVAFLGVGILLLVIGFLSPLPPASSASEKNGNDSRLG